MSDITLPASPASRQTLSRALQLCAPFALGLAIWFLAPPEGVTVRAWHLFAVFAATIFAVMTGFIPILAASLLAGGAVVLTGTLSPADAYAGFSEGVMLLIIVAFLVASGVVKSGLGKRIAFLIIRRFGRSTLGLAYSMVATDCLIAPAFPSNTARSGVLFPIVQSLVIDSGSRVEDGTRKKTGAFLMMNSLVGLTISSTLWLTAMAANPTGVDMARRMGVELTFGSWLLAALVPTLAAFVAVPYLLYRVFPPELRETPQAPAIAERVLADMGPMSEKEWVTAVTFVGMVVCWVLSSWYPIDKAAVAFLGLAVLMLAGVFTLDDMKRQGEALSTLIWFALLFALSTSLNKLGFMGYLGSQLAGMLHGSPWPVVYVTLVAAYVAIHYLFASQTAHMLALFGVFLQVAVESQVPGAVAALMLLFATNFSSAVTPQGSSANAVFAGSGYLTASEIYRNGAIVTAANLVIYLAVGTPWILLVIGR